MNGGPSDKLSFDISDLADAGAPENAEAADASLPGGVDTPAEPSSPAVDKVLAHLGTPNVSPDHKAELAAILANIDLQSAKPDEDPKVLAVATKQLEEWGYKRVDNHSQSIKATTEAEKKAAEINEYTIIDKFSKVTQEYVSHVGIYNFETTVIGDKLAWVKTSSNRLMDRLENMLRTSGDKGGNVLSALFKNNLRGKASAEQIAKNISELGLEDTFQVVREGGEVKSINENIEDLKKGAFLDDLLRHQDEDGEDFLQSLNPDRALQLTGKMLDDIHRSSGRGVGEVLANDIVLQVENGEIKGVRLALPDVAYEEDVEAIEQQATDLLDLCFSVGTAGLQKGGEDTARANISSILANYSESQVKAKMKQLMEAGQPHLTMHNTARLGYDRIEDKEAADQMIRNIIRNSG